MVNQHIWLKMEHNGHMFIKNRIRFNPAGGERANTSILDF